MGDVAGGEREIRTLDTLTGIPVFETGAFNHSATSPLIKFIYLKKRQNKSNQKELKFLSYDILVGMWRGYCVSSSLCDANRIKRYGSSLLKTVAGNKMYHDEVLSMVIVMMLLLMV